MCNCVECIMLQKKCMLLTGYVALHSLNNFKFDVFNLDDGARIDEAF